MTEHLEILTEEASMEAFLRGILPRLLPEKYQLDKNCFIRPHSGKSHLMQSIPKKMKAYPYFPNKVRVLILHDQDSNDCRQLKTEIIQKCNTVTNTVVRIACRELENWYLGDFASIEALYPHVKADQFQNKSKYRYPDLLNGSHEVEKLTRDHSKVRLAREMGKIIRIGENKSTSFGHFVQGLQKLLDSK